MTKYKTPLLLLNLLVLIIYFNWSILQKEKTLAVDTFALFELAPVDPRSLMQGDYMDLSYKIARENRKISLRRGYCVIQLDANKVANSVRFQASTAPLDDEEYLIKYFKSGRTIRLGAESYFFEEGTAAKYEVAKYGGLKIDAQGNSILVGLYDESFRLIE